MKKTITAITLAMVLMVSTSFANGGIIVAGFGDNNDSKTKNPCETVKVDNGIIVAGFTDGIIVAGFTGIIVAGFTGIIVAGATDENPPVNCGIIVAG